ncbi:MAG: hypothetical protein GY869_11430 [Planctomycetes bacterium]|nr:hypothetical protein [Planctomycetota bacterium]
MATGRHWLAAGVCSGARVVGGVQPRRLGYTVKDTLKSRGASPMRNRDRRD